MPSASNEDKDAYERAETFQRLFVAPVVETMKQQLVIEFKEIKADLARDRGEVTQLGTRVTSLENNQKKALLGYSGIVLLVTAGWNFLNAKIQTYFRK